jgi:hypothetical protein
LAGLRPFLLPSLTRLPRKAIHRVAWSSPLAITPRNTPPSVRRSTKTLRTFAVSVSRYDPHKVALKQPEDVLPDAL